MQCQRLRFRAEPPSSDRRERRSRSTHPGVLGAVVALAFCSWMVVVQQETPELDASTARESLVVLDELLAAPGSEQR